MSVYRQQQADIKYTDFRASSVDDHFIIVHGDITSATGRDALDYRKWLALRRKLDKAPLLRHKSQDSIHQCYGCRRKVSQRSRSSWEIISWDFVLGS